MMPPKRNIKVLNKELPVGTEVSLLAADLQAVDGVPEKAKIRAIEFSVRDAFDFRFAHEQGQVDSASGTYRTVKGSLGQTLFHEDLDVPQGHGFYFNNASGTGATQLEVVFAHN